MVLTVYVV